MRHVVIAGGGFAGVRLARKLSKKHFSVTLINDSEDFRYCPALYRAATGHKIGVARLSLEWMLLDTSNVALEIGTVDKINPQDKTIHTSDGREFNYDYCVLALGSVSTYFNIDGLHEHSVGMKTVDEIFELRSHLHNTVVNGSAQSNYVVVGAGPTGVEMAAALGGYLDKIAKSHNLKSRQVSVWLVEAADRLLPNNSLAASKLAQRRLEKIGVKILTDTRVEAESIHTLQTSAGPIKTDTVVWTAGSEINPFYKNQKADFKLSKRRLVKVNPHSEGLPSVYVIGDNADTTYSGLAQTAIRQADYVAKDLGNRARGRSRKARQDKRPFQIIPVGDKWAIFEYGRLVIKGRVAWWLRRLADYIGYADVLGYIRALTIWKHSESEEDYCKFCQSKHKK